MNRIRGEEGASAIEFALLLPVIIMLLLAMFEFGLAYSNYLSITHAAREGARLASVNKFSEAAVREKAYPVQPDSVFISYPNGNTHGETVLVTVTYNKEIDIPFWGAVAVPMSSSASMRIEY